MKRNSQNIINTDYPKGAVPIGTLVRSKARPDLWGVINDALVTHMDMDDQEVLSYEVRWCFPSNSSFTAQTQPTVADILGLDFFTGAEMEYNLIYLLDPNKEYDFATK